MTRVLHLLLCIEYNYQLRMAIEIHSILNIAIGVFMAQVAYVLSSTAVTFVIDHVKPKENQRSNENPV